MRLYIDKENILAFMSGKDDDSFDDSLIMIKKGMEVYYNFPKSEILSNPVLEAWFGRMKGCGVKFDSKFCPDATVKPERPVKSNFYNEYDSDDRSSIYLLNIEENTCNTIKDKRSILIGRPGDELEIFKILLKIPNRERLMIKISSWSEYLPKVPLTDAIICDNYYFKNYNTYRKNDNELIRALASIPKDSFSLVMIIEESEVHRSIDLEEECKRIKELISSVSKLSKKKCSVTLMTTYSTHSRHIVTNYYRVSPTSCVHLKDNGLKRDANIMIEVHTDPQSLDTTKELIKIFQDIAKHPIRIFGDRKSNFINFD